MKSKHETFSDFPVLPIVRNLARTKLMEIIGTLCLAFLDGNLEDSLDGMVTRSMVVAVNGKKKDGKPKRVLVGEVGDVIVH